MGVTNGAEDILERDVMVVDSTVRDGDIVIVEEAELDVNRFACTLSPFVCVGDVVVFRVGESLVIGTSDVGPSKELEDVCFEDLVHGNAVMDD